MKKKNEAPKWMEGDYALSIHGNQVILRNADTFESYTARCHPEDYFAIEDAITKVFIDKREAERKIKVGDKVYIVDSGRLYPCYTDWVFKNVNSPAKCMYDFNNLVPNTEDEYRVLAVEVHLVVDTVKLAYIQSIRNKKCYLINVRGLEKVVD